MPHPSSIVLSAVAFGYDPLGDPLLSDLNATIPPGRTGVVGRNGTGKTTLLRLLTGELSPTAGSISTPGEVAQVPQDLFQRPTASVAALLGIDGALAGLRAIEAGSVDQADFDAVGADWDVEARALALLARRVPSLVESSEGATPLDRTAETLSGGELMLVAMVGLELSGAPVAILDEPTNNLDSTARTHLYEAVAEWNGTLLVVSHDVALLNLMEQICELHDGRLRVFGGNFDAYREQLATEQAAATQAVRTAEQGLRAERRQRDHVQTAMARRLQKGNKDFANKRAPKIIMNTWAMRSEKSRADEVNQAAAKVDEARERVEAAESKVRDTRTIRVDLADPDGNNGRRLAELVGTNRTVHVMGGDRIALVGDNGVGKTSLLRTLLHADEPRRLPAHGRLLTRRVGYLDQHLALDEDACVLDVVREAAPTRLPQEVRAQLARFLIRGDMVEQPVGTLSGGERFRVAFARMLLADPPPELLILDEPTNDLDLESVEQLLAGLRDYRGALLVVSHDQHLLDQLDLREVITLDADGSLT